MYINCGCLTIFVIVYGYFLSIVYDNSPKFFWWLIFVTCISACVGLIKAKNDKKK